MNMNIRSLVSNASVAFLAQGISMVLSIVMSLLVPKVLGVEQYGYWQLFIFYIGYTGFFYLGLNDGIYLVEGGKTRDEINKRSINSQFLFGTSYQLLFGLLIVLIALAGGFGLEREFVITWTAIFLVLNNSGGFLGYLFQAMNETKIYSLSCILERVVFLLPLAVLLLNRVNSFEPYVYAYAFSTSCKLVYCIWHYRDFLNSGLESISTAVREACVNIRIGIKLMFANIASQLILGVARFVIDGVWGIATFGQLSFSLSMVNFFLAFVTQASMVLFPALRQSDEEDVIKFYNSARDILGLVFPVVYILYFPMVLLLNKWLPQYTDSFIYLPLLLPICVFDSKMNITCTTFFKVRRQESLLLRINIVTASVSCVLTLCGAYVFHSVLFIIGGVVLALIGRSVVSERFIASDLGVSGSSGTQISLGEIVLTVVFVALALLTSYMTAMLGFICAYALYLWAFRERVRGLLSKVLLRRYLK
jgi:O-antigen/teichoic acid export membrane protein